MAFTLPFRYRNCSPWMFGVAAFAALWIARQGGLAVLDFTATKPTVAICSEKPVPSGVVLFAEKRLASHAAVERAIKTIAARTGKRANTSIDSLARGLTCELFPNKTPGRTSDRFVTLTYTGRSSMGAELVEELARQFVISDLARLDQSLSDRVAFHRQQMAHLQSSHSKLELAVQEVAQSSASLQAAVRQARVERASFRFASNVAVGSLDSVTARRVKLGGQLAMVLKERSRLLNQIVLERWHSEQLQNEISLLNQFRHDAGAVALRVERIRSHYFAAMLLTAELICLLGVAWWARVAPVLPPRLADTLVGQSNRARKSLAIPVLECNAKQISC